ncbi:hypothetical protein [Arundinibacter roseus]|uniref:Uncharacterized protein n=1 Tax=Arundinibacter roseus TaxID=2070510 RepID=A0A4R4K2H1_9BACT|nr:hypothetical protein [Arundinibacter roseus]TDB61413.1 hypothetical protein EZE20_19610 [Arundinibacter roseus]
MKYIKQLSLVALLGVMVMGCESPLAEEKLDEFNLEQGGYMRIVTPFPVNNATFNVSKANLGGTKLELVHEAVTPSKGANFAQYELVIRFVDATPANGTNNVADKAFRTIAASTFSADPVTGYPRATMTITGQEALTAVGLTADQISAGDRFEFRGTMKLTDGRAFNALNTGANITGGPFYSSPFFYRINVAE